MTIKTKTALGTETTTNVTSNTTGANTGQNVQDLLENIIESTWGTRYVTSIDDGDSPYTADLDAESVIIADDTSGAITINLPAVASSTHKILTVKKTSASNSVTLDGNSSEEIDGATTKVLSSQYDHVTIICDGSAWHIIGE
jgi:hypothetical protein